MAYSNNWHARKIALLAMTLSLTACGSLSTRPTVVQEAPTIPAPDAMLMEDLRPSSEAYSKKVEDFLKKAVDALRGLRRQPLPCKPTSNQCA